MLYWYDWTVKWKFNLPFSFYYKMENFFISTVQSDIDCSDPKKWSSCLLCHVGYYFSFIINYLADN